MTLDNQYNQIWESIQDSESRKQLIDEHINVGIAFQINGIRQRQGLSQKKLAERLGIKQPLISAWENPNYGKYTLQTLKDIAIAFDVGLLVRFVPFSKMIEWTINLTNDTIAPPNFTEEKQNILNSLIDEVSEFINKANAEVEPEVDVNDQPIFEQLPLNDYVNTGASEGWVI
jgi:transcriptional regulator with XRE-family HTH domain